VATYNPETRNWSRLPKKKWRAVAEILEADMPRGILGGEHQPGTPAAPSWAGLPGLLWARWVIESSLLQGWAERGVTYIRDCHRPPITEGAGALPALLLFRW